mgnify:CR=1 FL=1
MLIRNLIRRLLSTFMLYADEPSGGGAAAPGGAAPGAGDGDEA